MPRTVTVSSDGTWNLSLKRKSVVDGSCDDSSFTDGEDDDEKDEVTHASKKNSPAIEIVDLC